MLSPGERRAQLWQRIFLIVTLIWALAVVVPDVYRLYWPLGSLGFRADNDGNIYNVYGPPADSVTIPGLERRGLMLGDAIDLRSAPCWRPTSPQCASLLGVFGGMGGLAYVRENATITLPIIAEGQAAEITLHPHSELLAPAARLVLAFDEFAAVLVLWLAFRLAWNRFGAMTVGFFLFVTWFNPGQYFAFYAWLQGHPALLLAQECLQALAQGAGYAGFLIFTLRFPHDRTEPQFRGIERIALALGAILTIFQLWSFTNVLGVRTEIVTRCAVLGGYAVAIYAFSIAWRRRKLQTPVDYQRMRWVLWGAGIGLPAFILADSNEATSLWDYYIWPLSIWRDWSPSETIFECGYLLCGVLAIFICQAVRRPRIGNVSIEVQRVTTGAVVLVLFTAAETWLHEPITELFKDAGVPAPWQFPISVGAALMTAAASHRGSYFADHLLNHRLFDEIERLNQLGISAKHARRMEELDAILLAGPTDALRLASAVVFREENGSFKRTAVRPVECAQELPSSEDQLPIAALKAGHAVPMGPPCEHVTEAGVALTAPTLALPVMVGGKLVAVALYGPHVTGDDIERSEIQLMEKFAENVAVGYLLVRSELLENELHPTLKSRAS
jgi:hypothetical protein